MTEEQKALFRERTQKIALEIMELAMELPGSLIDVVADDSGYFHTQWTYENTLFTYSKTAGHTPRWEEMERTE